MANFLNVMTHIKSEIQEAERTPRTINTKKKKNPCYVYHIQMPKKEKQIQRKQDILRKARVGRKHFIYKKKRIRITIDFSLQKLCKQKKKWSKMFKVLKEKKIKTRFAIPNCNNTQSKNTMTFMQE